MMKRIFATAILGGAFSCVATSAYAFTAIAQVVALAVLNVTGASLLTASVIGVGITAGLFIGGSMLLTSLLTPKPGNPNRGADAQAVINQATSPRVRVYGRAKVGGVRAFWESKDGALHQIIMLASHRLDAIESYWIGDKQVTIPTNGGAVSAAPFVGKSGQLYAYIYPFLGGANQGSWSLLVSRFPGVWTTNHRLRGIAYLGVIFADIEAENIGAVWPQSYNTPVRAVVRGARVYDPRDPSQTVDDAWVEPATWKWSDNPALCILDYLRCPDGMNKPNGRIDFASFIEFADLCDEAVPLKAGGTEKRYRLGGTVVLTEDPVDALQRMLVACDGELYQTGDGKIGIRGGRWSAPTVTIQNDKILAIGEISEGSDAFSAFNELKVIYTSPLHDYQPQEAMPWVDTAHQADHGQIVEDLVLDMVPSPSQARRLAKIHMYKQNPELRGSIITNLAGLNAAGERTINCIISELSVSDSFMVTGFSLRPDLTACEIGISSLTAAAYSWNAATEEGDNPPPPEDTRPDLSLPVPQGLSLSINGAGHVAAEVDDPLRLDLVLQAQIKAGAGGTYAAMVVDLDIPFEAASSDAASSGVTYFVRARWVRDEFPSDWSAEESITAP